MSIRMRRFYLQRNEDETGVSGEGIVGEGVEFTNGGCVMEWKTEFTSICIYENIKALEAIHGHGGKTKVVWVD